MKSHTTEDNNFLFLALLVENKHFSLCNTFPVFLHFIAPNAAIKCAFSVEHNKITLKETASLQMFCLLSKSRRHIFCPLRFPLAMSGFYLTMGFVLMSAVPSMGLWIIPPASWRILESGVVGELSPHIYF